MNVLRRIMLLLKTYYDKVLAGLALTIVVASIVFITFQLGRMNSERRDFSSWMTGMSPEHPVAGPVDVVPYRVAQSQIDSPHQVTIWTNGVFVPEKRCWCVDCRRPIAFEETVCPFCFIEQPPDPEDCETCDFDDDKMYDKWEDAHGLNKGDPNDGQLDPDNDGFTNLEEFNAVPRTDPNDPTSRPPILQKLFVEDISALPFKLLFKSVSKLPDGNLFAINLADNGRTWFRKLGDEIEGFKLVKFEPKFVKVMRGGIEKTVEGSILTLERDAKRIPLTMGKRQSYLEYSAELIFSVDGQRFKIKPGDTFSLLEVEYKVIAIDIETRTVVIEPVSGGPKFTVRRPPDTSI
ncbi:MAG: hypothetical protein O3A51_08005 [Verrucomicrobia bacterium]|nr:hypothetical protein [Verrucomicrobiota bacterium]